MQKEKKNIDLLTAMDADDSGTMDSCIKCVYEEVFEVKDWDSLRKITNPKNDKKVNDSSLKKFVRVVSRVLTDDSLKNGIFPNEEEKEVTNDLTETINKRLRDFDQSVTVIDIASLESLQQGVVFGAVIREIKRFCAEKKDKDKRVAVFIDEFNKYASMDVSSQDPILKSLIDIAETGRSIGLGLITAEQSYSIINRRIKANYANLIIGRTGVAELTQTDYMMIPDSYKLRIGTFDHGDAVLYTTYLNSGMLCASFPDKFYDEGK